MRRSPALVSLLLWPVGAQDNVSPWKDKVVFYYTGTKDWCAYGHANPVEFANITNNGGVCASIETDNRFYACYPPRDYCHAKQSQCKSGYLVPGSNQKLCGTGESKYCCLNYEECTSVVGSLDCVSPFSSPMEGLPIPEANKQFSEAGTGGATRTEVLPEAIKTIAYTATLREGVISTLLPGATSTSTTKADIRDLSTGGIVGVVAATIAAAVILTLVVTILLIRRRKRKRVDEYRLGGEILPKRVELDGKGAELMEMDVRDTKAPKAAGPSVTYELDAQQEEDWDTVTPRVTPRMEQE